MTDTETDDDGTSSENRTIENQCGGAEDARNEDIDATEVLELRNRVKELQKDLVKWTRQRQQLEKECEQQDVDPTDPGYRKAERNLQSALSLILHLVGKDELEDLMGTTKDDRKVMKKLLQTAQSTGKPRRRQNAAHNRFR